MAGLNRRDTPKRLSAFALGALGAGLASACGATTTPPPQVVEATALPADATPPAAATSGAVEVVYWHGWSGRFADYLDRVAVEFNKVYPEITVKFVQIDWGELYSEKYDPTKASAFYEAVTGSDAQAPFLTGMMSIYLSGP